MQVVWNQQYSALNLLLEMQMFINFYLGPFLFRFVSLYCSTSEGGSLFVKDQIHNGKENRERERESGYVIRPV